MANHEKLGTELTHEKLEIYHFERIERFKPFFIELVKELKESIDKGVYDTLVSDDVSGRLVTLALRRVMEARVGKAPKTFFYPGSRSKRLGKGQEIILKSLGEDSALDQEEVSYWSLIRQFFEWDRLQEEETHHALIVSDVAEFGETIHQMINALDAIGLRTDVAIAAIFGNPAGGRNSIFKRMLGGAAHEDEHKGHAHKFFGGKLTNDGGTSSIGIYGAPDLTGVFKERYEEGVGNLISVRKYRKADNNFPPEELEESLKMQKKINQAREDIKLLAQQTMRTIWS